MRLSWVGGVLVFAFLFSAGRATGADLPVKVIDDFENVSAWSAHPADGVDLKIGTGPGSSGIAMELDFHFSAGGYAVAHRAVDLDLPENYLFTFRVRGECRPNTLEFKLIDSTGANVWWAVKRDMTFPVEWQTISYRTRHLRFAWGPAGGGEIHHVAAIEFAVTAGQGGTGKVWIDDLSIQELPPVTSDLPAPVFTASSFRKGHEATSAADGDTATSWSQSVRDRLPWIQADFGVSREYGGVIVQWAPGQHPASYDVEASSDGTNWRVIGKVRQTNGWKDYLYLPESDSRYFRLSRMRGFTSTLALSEIQIMPVEWSETREKFYEAIVRDNPRGAYPRSFSGEQTYWTVVGADGDSRKALFSEDGDVEVGKGLFSVAPYLVVDGAFTSWADRDPEYRLEDDYLPIPTVAWSIDDILFEATAFATGAPEHSTVVVRYRLKNMKAAAVAGENDVPLDLHLAFRPFQVNPPRQDLNMKGGFAPVRTITSNDFSATVNDSVHLEMMPPPASIRATHFDSGDIIADYLLYDRKPRAVAAIDSTGGASGAFSYHFVLGPGQEREVDLFVPMHGDSSEMPPTDPRFADWVRGRFEAARKEWHGKLDKVTIEIPDPAGAEIARTAKAQLGYVLVNRAGAAFQPGVRSYARSWIRDGSLTSSALLRMGQPGAVKDFIDWFAPHQYPNGKIPCVVDYRGADPVPEHDSSGEFIFLVAEYYRYTGDRALLDAMWPRVKKAAAYLDSLRQERRTKEYETGEKKTFFGLLPESISHEGYSAKPMHSYWDDFFALKGFKDAVYLAGEEDDWKARDALTKVRNEFSRDLRESITASMSAHQIDYVPGCADLGDFDATSTTIALSPVEAGNVIPPGALDGTFDRYWKFFRGRLASRFWGDMTPYENRNIGAFVRLGEPDRAQEVAEFMMYQRRPAAWKEWAEVVDADERKQRFIGDMPHTWCGSDFIRSALDMLAYVQEDDSTIVIGAGVPLKWIGAFKDGGLRARGLPTPYGNVSYTIRPVGDDVELSISDGVRVPEGGIVVKFPFCEETVVRKVPATLTLKMKK